MADIKVSPYYTGALRAFYVTVGFWGLVVISIFFGEVSWVHRFDYAGRPASIFALALACMVIFAAFAFYFPKKNSVTGWAQTPKFKILRLWRRLDTQIGPHGSDQPHPLAGIGIVAGVVGIERLAVRRRAHQV